MTDRAACLARDRADPLGGFRGRFHIPPGLIYLDGNSLGMMPKAVPERLQQVAAGEWGEGLVRSWTDAGWWDLPCQVGGKIAPLIGADADEVVATDTTSVNLFKLLVAAVQLRPGRRVILSDPDNFPTDLYIAQGVAGLLEGVTVRLLPVRDLLAAIDESVAVVTLSHVDYKTAEIHDMAGITARARAAGALVVWDLSHAAGAIEVDLHGAQADLAVGCSYKYLNGGPGAPAWLFVRRGLQDAVRPPLSGWWGHAEPFAFADEYRPAAGIARHLCGTQSPLAMASLDAALDIWRDVDMPALRAKSIALTELFIALVERDCAGHGLALASPRERARRGSHVSFRHPEGNAVMRALRAAGVIGDFRSPDVMRFACTPLYIGYADVFDAVQRLAAILAGRDYDQPGFRARLKVT
jgi:kynureninase